MNEQQRRLMGKPSITGKYCPFCGRPAQSKHHIVPRSQGGKNGPVVSVCGWDNSTGCHGLFHHHVLHLDWNDEYGAWEWMRTEEPMKEWEARLEKGWHILKNYPWMND